MFFAHVTDLHLVPPGRTLYGLDPLRNLEAVLASVGAVPGLDFVLITGDLAHHGDPRAYAALRDALAELPVPCHLTIGNHDDRPNFREAFPQAPRAADDAVQFVIETEAAAIVVLDSHQKGRDDGELGEERLGWLAAQLERLRGRRILVALHHPPMDLALPCMDPIKLHDAAALAACLDGHRIAHLLFGHVHRTVSGSWRGIPFNGQRGLNHQVALHFSDVGVPGSMEPPAYSLCRFGADGLVVHMHEMLGSAVRFDLLDEAAASAHSVAELCTIS